MVAAIICPSPDPWTMCIYAVPMLALYLIGIGVAWWVHPSRRKAKEAKEAAEVIFFSSWQECWPRRLLTGRCFLAAPLAAACAAHFNGAKALEYARQFVAIGPRWPTSPGHVKAEEFLRNHSSTTSWKRIPSPPTRPSARWRCATSSCAFPAKRTA